MYGLKDNTIIRICLKFNTFQNPISWVNIPLCNTIRESRGNSNVPTESLVHTVGYSNSHVCTLN